MNIAIIAPPHIAVPPPKYGGTELFVAHLATALTDAGHRVVVYANGESRLPSEVRWLYATQQWPIADQARAQMINLDHQAWAVADAAREGFDLVHANDAFAVHFAPLLDVSMMLTLHHPREPVLSDLYRRHPEVQYVAISRAQARAEPMPGLRVIHHGLDPAEYRPGVGRRTHLCFLGRMVACKGAHTAIEVARRTGIPLKIAGEIQPLFRDYWEARIRPHVDGRLVEYVGEADLAVKNDLLGSAVALLVPIEWEEPFGLVMIEAMACGAPVLAFRRGSVPEIVSNGVSGWICRDVDEMTRRAASPGIPAATCRRYMVDRFSAARMARDYARAYQELVRLPGVA